MDLSKLENTLNVSVDPSEPEYIRSLESLKKHAQDIGWEHFEAFMYHDLSKRVQDELESMQMYKENDGWFVNQENGGYGFHPFMVAPDLVQISFKKGVEAAIRGFV